MKWTSNGLNFYPGVSGIIFEELPKGVFALQQNQQNGEFFLTKTENLQLPKKLYGDFSITERWLKSYNHYENNTAVLLSGLKGSGKTIMLMKTAIDSGLPIININQGYCGPQFEMFMSQLNNVCVIIDEYEKHYTSDDAELSILNLLDGPVKTHNLYLLTCNEMSISEYLVNRPSRVRYLEKFENLPESLVREVALDLLNDKSQVDGVVDALEELNIITYDILITIIKEMNFFNESASSVCSHLNLEMESAYFDVFYKIDEVEYLIEKSICIDPQEFGKSLLGDGRWLDIPSRSNYKLNKLTLDELSELSEKLTREDGGDRTTFVHFSQFAKNGKIYEFFDENRKGNNKWILKRIKLQPSSKSNRRKNDGMSW